MNKVLSDGRTSEGHIQLKLLCEELDIDQTLDSYISTWNDIMSTGIHLL